MVNAITVNNDGKSSSINVKHKNGSYHVIKNHDLCIHYQDQEFLILSEKPVCDILLETVSLLHFSLPPPLNTYIYPENIIIVKLQNSKPENLTCEDFLEYCTKFKADMIETKHEVAIYDVPLNENVYDNEYESEEDDEAYDESDDEEKEDIDDEDWDVEDDDPPVT